MAIRLLIEGSTIIEASYRCNGCTYAHQLGRGVSHFLRGRTVTQARLLDKDDVLSIAGPVPEGKDVYAAMLAEALQDALNAHDQLNHSEP